jgi:WhiB family transcriptional regulator, redox-sensing transcriptional regulator
MLKSVPIDAEETASLPCRENEVDLWFSARPAEVELAKSLCAECPVRDLCFSGARDRQEPWGVWGGELFVDGVVVAHKKPRGRPRKTSVAA